MTSGSKVFQTRIRSLICSVPHLQRKICTYCKQQTLQKLAFSNEVTGWSAF